jgi:c-di-GMP-binding flagellar brake protein YcgR
MFGKTAQTQSRGFGTRVAPPPAEGLHVERRTSRRLRVHKSAQIILHDHNSAIDVVVHDISEGGLRVRVEGYMYLPDRFELRFQDQSIPCRIAMTWRRGLEMGLAFVQ